MNRFSLVIGIALMCTQLLRAEVSAEHWDVLETYEGASHLFVGSIMWVENASDLTVKTRGYRLSAQSSRGLELADVDVHAQRYVVTVEELFKGSYPEHIELVTPVIDGHEWIIDDLSPQQVRFYDTGVFGGNLTGQLEERGLFVVQERARDGLHVLKRVEPLGSVNVSVGVNALRLASTNRDMTLKQAIQKLLEADHQRLEEEAERVAKLQGELDAVLMLTNRDERMAGLLSFIKGLGYEGLWSYDDFMLQRRKQERELQHSNQRLPQRPEDPIEGLWHDASQEVERLKMVLDASSEGDTQ